MSRIPLMTKDELKSFREKLGLSQNDLAKYLRVAPNTVSRWELGNAKIPEYLDLALRAIESDLQLTEIIRNIMLDAAKEGRLISEDELVEKLNNIPNFWKKAVVIDLLKKNLSREISKNN